MSRRELEFTLPRGNPLDMKFIPYLHVIRFEKLCNKMVGVISKHERFSFKDRTIVSTLSSVRVKEFGDGYSYFSEVFSAKISEKETVAVYCQCWTCSLDYEDSVMKLVHFIDASMTGYRASLCIRLSLRGGGKDMHDSMLYVKSYEAPAQLMMSSRKCNVSLEEDLVVSTLKLVWLSCHFAATRDHAVGDSGKVVENGEGIQPEHIITPLNNVDGLKKCEQADFNHTREKATIGNSSAQVGTIGQNDSCEKNSCDQVVGEKKIHLDYFSDLLNLALEDCFTTVTVMSLCVLVGYRLVVNIDKPVSLILVGSTLYPSFADLDLSTVSAVALGILFTLSILATLTIYFYNIFKKIGKKKTAKLCLRYCEPTLCGKKRDVEGTRDQGKENERVIATTGAMGIGII